ncbi:unnamed protein product [Lactuca virosa]|uniref:Uncharacterized protein n=1 Tax=Lactuca virosa TaxID=75947 RepID=A0AAU9PK10_9ASTR|nr:unnamed protein product [Lactuca virosa]
MEKVSFKIVILAMLLLIPCESKLGVVEGRSVTNGFHDVILKACKDKSECKCTWFWQTPKCKDGSCKCR